MKLKANFNVTELECLRCDEENLYLCTRQTKMDFWSFYCNSLRISGIFPRS